MMDRVKFLDQRLAETLGKNIRAVAGAATTNNMPIADTGKIGEIAHELLMHGQQTQNEVLSHKMSLTKKYGKPHFSICLDGVGTMPTGNIQAIKAKSKGGKSFLCSILIASLLGCTSFGLATKIENPKVVYIDTEQDETDTAELIIRTHRLLGWKTDVDYEGFSTYNIRTVNTTERLTLIDDILKLEKPTNVFIDGVADLLGNFNDLDQSSMLIDHLMQLSTNYKCSITCVLHTNKAKDDDNMKGHLGTLLLQKSSDVYETKRDNGVFNVSETDCRHVSIPDFAFGVDANGMPYSSQTISENKKLKKLEGIAKHLKECFQTDSVLSYSDLIKLYSANAAISDRQAKRVIKEAKENDLLRLSQDGGYCM